MCRSHRSPKASPADWSYRLVTTAAMSAEQPVEREAKVAARTERNEGARESIRKLLGDASGEVVAHVEHVSIRVAPGLERALIVGVGEREQLVYVQLKGHRFVFCGQVRVG